MSWVLDLIRESRLACALGSEESGWEEGEAVGCQAISHLLTLCNQDLGCTLSPVPPLATSVTQGKARVLAGAPKSPPTLASTSDFIYGYSPFPFHSHQSSLCALAWRGWHALPLGLCTQFSFCLGCPSCRSLHSSQPLSSGAAYIQAITLHKGVSPPVPSNFLSTLPRVFFLFSPPCTCGHLTCTYFIVYMFVIILCLLARQLQESSSPFFVSCYIFSGPSSAWHLLATQKGFLKYMKEFPFEPIKVQMNAKPTVNAYWIDLLDC